MNADMKSELIAEMKRVGAFDVRVADPHQGFEHAPQGRHPLEPMPGCRMAVAFVVPKVAVPDSFFAGIRRSHPTRQTTGPRICPQNTMNCTWDTGWRFSLHIRHSQDCLLPQRGGMLNRGTV